MGLSRYLIRAASKFYFGARAAWTYPDLHLGLFATLPTGPDDAGAEVSGYARVHTPDGADWQRTTVAGTFRFETLRGLTVGPFAAPAVVTGFGLWDALTSGNLLIYGALTAPVTVPPGRRIYLPPGAPALSGALWHYGPLVTLMYVFPQSAGLGPPSYQQPTHWQVYPLTRQLTHDDYLRNYSGAPAGYAEIANTAANWPLVGADVTNGVAWSYAPAAADGPDVTALLCVAKFSSGAYAPYWQPPLTASATVRAGERLEIAAGNVAFAEL